MARRWRGTSCYFVNLLTEWSTTVRDPVSNPVDHFSSVAERLDAWAFSEASAPEEDLVAVCQLLADLVAAGCALGWSFGAPSSLEVDPSAIAKVKARASNLPLRYYSEIFNNLVVPAEEPVTGDLADDLADIYCDIVPGLALYRSGRHEEAADHWRFWFAQHWGEHATSALRAAWSFLARREGSTRSADG